MVDREEYYAAPLDGSMKTEGGVLTPWLLGSALWMMAAGAISYFLAGLTLASAVFWLVILAPPLAVAALFWAAVWFFAGVFIE